MKLRSITMENIRRFTDLVRIDGIADGVNVLSAPNESGKSTVFDALRALFFIPHGSRAAEITKLKPYAGGAPEVSVEIETADGLFVVSKRWFSKAEARVMRAGTLIAQADEAEAWINRLLAGGQGGPSGLLWVRQGITGLSEGTSKEQQTALDARRDLLSSVTGEVEAMTGGRRMDHALEQCRKDLEAYASSTGRPKAHGPWKTALEEVQELREARDRYEGLVAVLETALQERSLARRELAELEEPTAANQRATRLTEATRAHEAARAHAVQVEAADRAMKAAAAATKAARTILDTLRQAAADVVKAEEKERETRAGLETAQTECDAAEASFNQRFMAHGVADAERIRSEGALKKAQARELAASASERRAEIADQLAKALAAREAVETTRAEASVGPDDKQTETLRGLAGAVKTARALRDSTATRLVMRYAQGATGGVSIGDHALADGVETFVHSEAVLQVSGLGTLTVHPGADPNETGDVAKAEAALAKALSALGCSTLQEAADAHGKRQDAQGRLTQAQAHFAALAPHGIEALQRRLAALPAPAEDESAAGQTVAEANADFEAARNMAAEGLEHLEAARERRDRKRTARAEATVRQEAAQERLGSAQAALDRLPTTDEAVLAEAARHAEQAEAQAARDLGDISANAPDLKAIEATLARAQSIDQGARKKIGALRPQLAALDERISGTSGDAVEERLQETEEKLEAAESRLARIEREVRVLQRLQAALEEARSQARDRYFAPIAQELRPLLHLLWPDAELNWTDDTLLPQSLTRNGQDETVDILSGGTQEQIALLVRLAFARLLANDGRHAPVILDDALVFTDDDRIERMFDALHRQAGDLQIIVLSCRQRAFRDLGGTALRIQASELA